MKEKETGSEREGVEGEISYLTVCCSKEKGLYRVLL